MGFKNLFYIAKMSRKNTQLTSVIFSLKYNMLEGSLKLTSLKKELKLIQFVPAAIYAANISQLF